MQRQPDHVRTFLLTTSVLERLSGPPPRRRVPLRRAQRRVRAGRPPRRTCSYTGNFKADEAHMADLAEFILQG